FRWSGTAIEGELIGLLDLFFERAGFCQPRGEMLALLQDEWIIQNGQSLEGSHGDIALGAKDRGIRAIKRIHQRIGHAAHDETIDAASVTPGTIRVEQSVVIDR